jgi:AcrR family transcriptional regulator
MLEETRAKLLAAGRQAFAEKGYAAASMDELTAQAGLTRGALYHHFGDKKGLLAAVVEVVDTEMAARAHERVLALKPASAWEALVAEGLTYIELALDPEIQRIVLKDGPAYLGDPSQWPSQSACLAKSIDSLNALRMQGVVKPVDAEAAARLINGAALDAAQWVAASDEPEAALPKAQTALKLLLDGLKA